MWIFNIIHENIYHITEDYITPMFKFIEDNKYISIDINIIENIQFDLYSYIMSFFININEKKEMMIITYRKNFQDTNCLQLVINKYKYNDNYYYNIILKQKNNINLINYLLTKLLEFNYFLLNKYINNDLFNKLNIYNIYKFPNKLLEYHQNDIIFNEKLENFIYNQNNYDYDFDNDILF